MEMHPVTQYALDVVEGRMIVGRFELLACKRHLRDLERQGSEDFPYFFDENKADRVFKWFNYCKHVKGKLAGKSIELIAADKFVVGSVFGWIHKDTKLRRFRKVYEQKSRKNAKSTKMSGVALYMLAADNEQGAEIYCTATKRDQAKIVYNDAKAIAEKSPDIKKRLRINDYRTIHKKSNSIMKALSKDTKSQDGLNPHLGEIDEYHAHPDSSMYDVLVSGMGQRSQPLLWVITTAGFDLAAPCYIEYQYACDILEGIKENDTYAVFIYQMDKDDDIQDEKNWIKCNPLLATTEEGMKYLRDELKIAMDVPEKMRNYLTKNLNIWVDQKENGYMNMDKWKECGATEKDPYPDLKNMDCIAGVDLAKKIDLTSISFEFKLSDGRIAVWSHSFIPEDTLKVKKQTDKVPYDLWIEKGWITVIPGAVVDTEYVEHYVFDMELEHGWKVQEICYDPYGATQFANRMQDKGYTIVEIRQGVKTLSEPTKNFRELTYQKKIIHNNNPVLTWAMNNAVVYEDKQENIMLDKDKSRERIDPAAATINSHVRLTILDQVETSVYDERGVRF